MKPGIWLLLAIAMVHFGLSGCSDLTPTQSAILSGDQQKLARLLASGADVNGRLDPNKVGRDHPGTLSPLHLAAREGLKDAVVLLLRSRALVNITDAYGYTPLHYAAYNGHKEVVEILVAYGAEVNVLPPDNEILVGVGNAPDNPPGVWGGGPTHIEVEYGRRPLDLAIEQRHQDVADVLRRHGATTGQASGASLSAELGPCFLIRQQGQLRGQSQ